MTSATSTEQAFRRLGQEAVRGLAGVLGELVGAAELKPARTRRWRRSDFLETLRTTQAVLTCTLGGEGDGTLTVMFPVGEAAAIAGVKNGSDPDAIEQSRQADSLDQDALLVLAELGSAVSTTWSGSLRDASERSLDVQFHSHGTLAPGEDASEVLPDHDLVTVGFSIKLADHPAATGSLIVEAATADRLNGAPLAVADDGGEDIPQAPIVGHLSAFLTDQSLLREVKQSCRRVGLSCQRHGRREIPNPAAHRGGFVLLDVPPGEDHRFEWCQRLKSYDETIRVVLLLHYPSRSRVLRAFKARADAILGCPMNEGTLSPKLQSLLEPPDAPEDDADDF